MDEDNEKVADENSSDDTGASVSPTPPSPGASGAPLTSGALEEKTEDEDEDDGEYEGEEGDEGSDVEVAVSFDAGKHNMIAHVEEEV